MKHLPILIVLFSLLYTVIPGTVNTFPVNAAESGKALPSKADRKLTLKDIPTLDPEAIREEIFKRQDDEGWLDEIERLPLLDRLYLPLITADILNTIDGPHILENVGAYESVKASLALTEIAIKTIEGYDTPQLLYFRDKGGNLQPAHLYLAKAYSSAGLFSKADSVFGCIAENVSRHFGPGSEQYFIWAVKAADGMCIRSVNLHRAIDILRRGVEADSRNNKIQEASLINLLLSYSEKSLQAGFYEDALRSARKATASARSDSALFRSNLMLASILLQGGDLKEAERHLLITSRYCRSLPDSLSRLLKYCELLRAKGEWEEALKILKNAEAQYLESPELSAAERFRFYETLGYMATFLDFPLAEKAFSKAEGYLSFTMPGEILEHLINSQIIPNRDNSFKYIAALDRGEFIYNNFIKDDPGLAARLLYLYGDYYIRIGDYPRGRDYLLTALDRSMMMLESDPLIISIYRSLSEMYRLTGKRELQRTAVEGLIRNTKTLPAGSPDRQKALSEAIGFYIDYGRPSEAAEYLEEFGIYEPSEAEYLSARLAIAGGNYAKGEEMLQRMESNPAVDREKIDALWMEWAERSHNRELAIYARRDYDNFRHRIARQLLFMNGSERRNLERELISRRDKTISQIKYFPGMDNIALDYSLLAKSLLFFTESRVRGYLTDTPEALQDYGKIMALKRELTRAEMAGNTEECRRLRAEIGSRERYIISDYVDFTRFENDLKRNSLTGLLTRISPEARYLDFVDLTLTDGFGRPYSYCGVFIIDGASKECRYAEINPMERVVGNSPSVWAILESELKGARDVFFSTDGELTQIPIEYYRDSDGRLYADRYRLHRVFHLADIHTGQKPGQKIVAAGVADYNSPIGKAKGIDRGSWTDLPQVTEEIRMIGERLRNKNVRILFNDEANENELKSLDGSDVNILHISAHGFYRDREALEKAAADTASSDHNIATRILMADKAELSGLVLRSGNLCWNVKEVSEAEDDLLTSDEVELLHFPDLRLTVLSACDTGRGEISGEGVWGLQRAFRIAGSRNLICTLSKVDDYWTSRFMDLFYEELSNGSDIYTSFHAAQRWVAEQTPDHPEIAEAFILIE